jgi:DNA-nicking Smr family endonuclease
MRKSVKKKNDFSDAELLSFALKDVKPFPGRSIKADIKHNTNSMSLMSEKLNNQNTSKIEIKNKPARRKLSHGDMPELNKGSARRMKRGKMQIDARLDLHGYRQSEAFSILSNFISYSFQENKRCVLVITGKGLHHAGFGEQKAGILKKMVPVWLNEEPNRSQILSFSHAKPSDGGVGALYVLLKKSRLGKDS